jgi:hypothetical protein
VRVDVDCVGADSASDRADEVVRQTGLNLKIKLALRMRIVKLCRTGTQKIAITEAGQSGLWLWLWLRRLGDVDGVEEMGGGDLWDDKKKGKGEGGRKVFLATRRSVLAASVENPLYPPKTQLTQPSTRHGWIYFQDHPARRAAHTHAREDRPCTDPQAGSTPSHPLSSIRS